MRLNMTSLIFAAVSMTLLTGFGEKHSSVETKSNFDGKSLAVQFLVKPDTGMKLTKEGPWLLTLNNMQGFSLKNSNGTFTNKEFDEKIPGFLITSEIHSQTSQVKADFVIKAFVCTENKKHCYPQLHKGTFEWKKP